MLTEHQLTHYQTFGFLILRDFLKPDEISKINTEFESKLSNTLRSTTRTGNHQYVSWPNLGPETPFTGGLLEDPRICEIAAQLLEGEIIGISCNSGSFVSDTSWHPDSEHIHFHSLKFASYLQPLTANNGALRFIPGSHINPFHDMLLNIGLSGFKKDSYIEKAGIGIGDVAAYSCAVVPGDVIVFDARLWHASAGGSLDRRLITLIFNRVPESPEEKEATSIDVTLSRSTRENLARNTYESPGPEYDPQWTANTENDPRRQRWINWMQEVGYMGD